MAVMSLGLSSPWLWLEMCCHCGEQNTQHTHKTPMITHECLQLGPSPVLLLAPVRVSRGRPCCPC